MTGNGIGRVVGLQLSNMGQTNVMGRYPFHYHFVNDGKALGLILGSKSYFSHNSMYHNYYRCISIHATNFLSVTNNVAYDTIGHCYYLEDGVEENNIVSHNLGAFVHFLGPVTEPNQFYGQQLADVFQSASLNLPADITASPFYIPNPLNTFEGNAASGGWSGFAFPGFARPGFASQAAFPNVRPHQKNTKVFNGNSAHSSGYWWGSAGCIYVGGWLDFPNGNSVARYNPSNIQILIRCRSSTVIE